jgi:ribonuclease P protein component
MARGDAALPRAERLRERGAIQRLFRYGARIERPGFVLLILRAPGPRAVVFAAGRRVGGSVERNRARRRLREAYRRQKGLVPATGVRLGFVARPAATAAPFDRLSAEVADALREAVQRVRG